MNSKLKEKNIRKWNTILIYIIITTIWRTKVTITIWAGIIENKFGNVKFLAWLLRWFPFVVWLSLLLLQSPEFVIVPMGRSFVSKFFMKWVIGICQSLMRRMEFKLDDERLTRWSVFTTFRWLKNLSSLEFEQGAHRQISITKTIPHHSGLSLHKRRALC